MVSKAVIDYIRNYQTQRRDVEKIELQMKEIINKIFDISPSNEDIDRNILSKAYEVFENRFDSLNGGWGAKVSKSYGPFFSPQIFSAIRLAIAFFLPLSLKIPSR